MRSRYRCVDCRRGVIVVIALNAGEHIICSRRFKAGNGVYKLAAVLPLGFFGGDIGGFDGILLFGNKVFHREAVGFYILYSRRIRLILIGLDYFKVAGRNGGLETGSRAGGISPLHGVLSDIGGLFYRHVAATHEVFNFDFHIALFDGAIGGSLLLSVIGKGLVRAKANSDGRLLLKYGLDFHIVLAHGEGYCGFVNIRQGDSLGFPLDELVVKVAWFGGKGDLDAFARILGCAINLAVAFYGNGQLARSIGGDDGVACYNCTRLVGGGFGITSLNIIGLAIFNGEAGG